MSLPWYPMDTMGPIASISRGAWTSKPPEWTMQAEFGAIVAAGMLHSWSLSQLAGRWCCGRRVAKRVVQRWLDCAAQQRWPADRLALVAARFPWLQPAAAPIVHIEVQSSRPDPAPVEASDPGGLADTAPRSRPGAAPVLPRSCPPPAGEGREGEGRGEILSGPAGPVQDQLDTLWVEVNKAWRAAGHTRQLSLDAKGPDGAGPGKSRRAVLTRLIAGAEVTPQRLLALWLWFLEHRDHSRYGVNTWLRHLGEYDEQADAGPTAVEEAATHADALLGAATTERPWLEPYRGAPYRITYDSDAVLYLDSWGPEVEAARLRIRAAGGGWHELEQWLAPRVTSPTHVMGLLRQQASGQLHVVQ